MLCDFANGGPITIGVAAPGFLGIPGGKEHLGSIPTTFPF